MEKYVPINCDYYDELEAIATIGKAVKIIYLDNESRVEVVAKIRDLYVRESVEYMKLDSGVEFRLDRLVEADGKPVKNFC